MDQMDISDKILINKLETFNDNPRNLRKRLSFSINFTEL